MRQAVIVLLAAIAGCASPKEAAVKWPTLDGKPPLVIAHRGASGYLPEHTLEAYALAIEQGADVIEPDLVFTKDGVLVARHDRYLSTTTNVADKPEFATRKRANNDPADAEHRDRVDWWVEDFTLAELKTLRARQPFSGRPKEHDDRFEIPTFAEMLALVAAKAMEAGRPVGVYPETKHPAYFASIGHDFERPLLEALEGFDAGPVFIQSFEPEILKRLKGKTKAKLVQLVYEKEPGAGPNIPLEEVATYADGVGAAKGLILEGKNSWTKLINQTHALGLFVHVWTFRTDRPNENVVFVSNFVGEIAGVEVDKIRKNSEATAVSDVTGPKEIDLIRADAEFRAFFLEGVDGVFADFPDAAVKARGGGAL